MQESKLLRNMLYPSKLMNWVSKDLIQESLMNRVLFDEYKVEKNDEGFFIREF
jgi:hypothetical protein